MMSKSEPLWTVAGITAAATAIIALLVAFGVPLTGDQREAILGVIAVLAPTVVALVGRAYVTPNAHVVERDDGDGLVVAGPANDQAPDGAVIRSLETGQVFVEGPRRARDDDGDGVPDVKDEL